MGLTGAAVLAVRGVILWDLGRVLTLWIALGTAGSLGGLLTWLRRSRLNRTLDGESATDFDGVLGGRGAAIQSDTRRHRRFVPARRATTLHTRDGRQIAARIVDISIAGVAVEARLTDVDFIAVTRVGAQAAGPVRRTPSGAVFGFDMLLDPQPFDTSFML